MTVSSKLFGINKEAKQFTAEASDISRHFYRVYPDAADAGFEMVSDKTGNTSVWVANRDKYDAEGDLVFTEFVPTPATLRKIPALRGWIALVYND